MKNKITDLNDYLYEQLDRLTNDELTGDKLTEEVKRAKAVTDTAKTIVHNSQLALSASKFLVDNGYTMTSKDNSALKLLGSSGFDDDTKILN